MLKGRPFELIDVHLDDSELNLQEVLRCIHVDLLCVQQRPVDRPNMPSIILMLASHSELPKPKPPRKQIHKKESIPLESQIHFRKTL